MFTSDKDALSRQIYSLSQSGKDDYAIALELDMAESTVTAIRKNYLDTFVEAPDVVVERAKWAARTEEVWNEMITAYRAGKMRASMLADSYAKIANVAMKMHGLEAAKKLDITNRGSKVDQEIEGLLGQFPAAAEEDTPL